MKHFLKRVLSFVTLNGYMKIGRFSLKLLCSILEFLYLLWFAFSFQKLVKTGENNWSLPELVHAVVLLAHYHALASFVFGSGINPERDPEISNGFTLISVNNFCVCDLANDNNIENASLSGGNFGVSFLSYFSLLFCFELLILKISRENFSPIR